MQVGPRNISAKLTQWFLEIMVPVEMLHSQGIKIVHFGQRWALVQRASLRYRTSYSHSMDHKLGQCNVWTSDISLPSGHLVLKTMIRFSQSERKGHYANFLIFRNGVQLVVFFNRWTWTFHYQCLMLWHDSEMVQSMKAWFILSYLEHVILVKSALKGWCRQEGLWKCSERKWTAVSKV